MRKRSKAVLLRLTEREHQHLKEQAALSGYSQEQYLRNLIAGEKMRPRPLVEMVEIRRQLNAIGNNINQIARKANSTEWVSREELAHIISFQDEIWDLVKRI